MAVQRRNPEMVSLLTSDFLRRGEGANMGGIDGLFTSLTGLRAYYNMASVDENGDVYDLSNQVRTLTNNNTVTFDYDRLVPYAQFVNASTQFLDRPDEPGLDITGTETAIVNGGITVGGWFNLDNLASNYALISKFTAAGDQRVFLLFHNSAAGDFTFRVSTDGIAITIAVSSIAPVAGSWFFIVGRLETSTETSIFVNGTKDDLGSGIASIFNSTAPLQVGANNAGTANLLDGRVSRNFVCAGALSDAILGNLYNQSRPAYS